MHPNSNQVCLTFSEPTKGICVTIPTLEDVRQLFAEFHELIVAHPYTSSAVLLFLAFYPKLPFQILVFMLYDLPRSIILGLSTCLGFEGGGVRPDSIAWRCQNRFYTPGGGIFSRSQSYGAINHELPPPYNGRPAYPQRETHIMWTILGWIFLYASLVILLKYGGGDI